ncbi:MAG: hypothetical protein U0M06_07560 [Clostridia bacterium]|nr:hypothetical protein [Clostridia bacterium]
MIKKRFFSGAAEFSLVFLTGAVLYYGIEIAWRGYSHIAMAILGGLCFLSLYMMGRLAPGMPLFLYCVLGGMIISLLEFCAGELLNGVLGLGIWDYSSLPLNFRGQVCLLFSFFWCLICMPAHFIASFFRRRIFGLPR